MKVAFYYHSGDVYRWMMDVAVAAVRKHMPSIPIWHLHGPYVHPHKDVDEALCMEKRSRCRHHSLVAGETLFLDVDAIVQEDVSEVFARPFEVAFAIRPKHDPAESWEKLPYNGGVSFSRSPAFWAELDAKMQTRGWTTTVDSELPLNRFIGTCGKHIATLDKRYNHAPTALDEDLSGQAIVHWKGPKRKRWMQERYA